MLFREVKYSLPFGFWLELGFPKQQPNAIEIAHACISHACREQKIPRGRD